MNPAAKSAPFIELELPHDAVEEHLDLYSERSSSSLFSQKIAALVGQIRPEWIRNKSGVDIEIYTNGITNKIFCLNHTESNEKMVIRLFGVKTEQLIDRNSEMANFERLHRAGLGPAVHARFINGFACGFLPGTCLDMKNVREPAIVEKICQTLARMHKIPLDTAHENLPMFGAKCADWLANLPTQFAKPEVQQQFDQNFRGSSLSDQLGRLLTVLELFKSPLVFAHNDLLIYNILYDEDGTGEVHFIDYEYAGPNYQLFDVANHFCEYAGLDDTPDFELNAATEEERRHFLRQYFAQFQQAIDESEMDKLLWKVRHFEAAAHFFWTLWAIHQAAISAIQFDYMSYANTRHRNCTRIMASLGID
uniref:ethanolamine kinase n=1 Tax=Globodera rostochiensis TaxID=31243 RepID=A0A914IBT9_GLORO